MSFPWRKRGLSEHDGNPGADTAPGDTAAVIALLLLAQLAVTDGDTLKAPWGERYRLHGIDAPELAQECTRQGEPYAVCKPSKPWKPC